MLSSDQPGEVAAAARAIGKTLKAEGRDWNWLAAKLADSSVHRGHHAFNEGDPDDVPEPWERREPPSACRAGSGRAGV
jgi:hypothetical protein